MSPRSKFIRAFNVSENVKGRKKKTLSNSSV